MADFESLLNVTADDVKEPPLLPAGLFSATVENYKTGESSQKKTPFVEPTFTLSECIETDDEAALEAYGSVAGKQVKTQFYLSEKAIFMLKNFLVDHLGLDMPGASFNELLAAAVGQECIVEIHHEMSQDGERTFAKVKRTLAPA